MSGHCWKSIRRSGRLICSDIRRLEAVRRRFTKKLGGLHTFPYERLTLLGLERLEVRRIREGLLFICKLFFGFTVLRAKYYFNLFVCTATRGHPYELFLTRCFTDVRKYFFYNLVVSRQ